MLKPECLELRRSYERGQTDPHLATCAECKAFADFVDGLAQLGVRAPLSNALRERLRELPEQEEGRALAMPRLPLLPLPAALERRLKQIARMAAARRELPLWIRNPRFAIAASYLLALVFAGTVGNPAAWGQSTVDRLDRVGLAIESVQATGRSTWLGLEERTTEGLALTLEFYRGSKSSLKASWLELVESIKDTDTTEEADANEGDATSS